MTYKIGHSGLRIIAQIYLLGIFLKQILLLLLLASSTVVAAVPSKPSITGPAYHIYRGTYDYSWTKPSGTTYFEVQTTWAGSTSTSRFTSTSFTKTHTDLGYYTARVRACNSSGCSGWSGYEVNRVVKHWKPNQTVTSGPSTSSSGSFTLTWSKPWGHGINKYIVERSDNGGSWQVVYSSSGQSLSQNLGNGTYRYRVEVCNIDNVCSGTGPERQVVVNIPPPVPSRPSVPYVNWDLYHPYGSSIPVSVPSISGATSYYIYNGSSESSRAVSKQVSSSGWTSVPSVGIGYNYLRIEACNASGCSGEGPSQRVKIFERPSAASVSVSSHLPSKNAAVTITWNVPSGTIWEQAYFNVKCHTATNSRVCDQHIPHRGSENKSQYSHTFTADHVGVYDIEVRTCNKSDSYCSTATAQVTVLPQTHGKPQYNLNWDIHHPIGSDIPLVISQGIDGADAFDIYYYPAGNQPKFLKRVLKSDGSTTISASTLGNHTLQLASCVTSRSGQVRCGNLSDSARIVVYDKPQPVQASIDSNNVLSLTPPAGMLWENGYFKVQCTTPSGQQSCNEQIAYRGDMALPLVKSLSFNGYGQHTVTVQACNENERYCSSPTHKYVDVLPAVHGHPKYNVNWDFYYPAQSLMRVNLAKGVSGATGFKVHLNKVNAPDSAKTEVYVKATEPHVDILIPEIAQYHLKMATCVEGVNGQPVCSQWSPSQLIVAYDKPQPVSWYFSHPEFWNGTVPIPAGEQVTLNWAQPSGTIFETAYYKFTCTPAGGIGGCDGTVRQVGDKTTYTKEITLLKPGTYSVSIQSCNESERYCSDPQLKTLNVLEGKTHFTAPAHVSIGTPFALSWDIPAGMSCARNGSVYTNKGSEQVTLYSTKSDLSFECTQNSTITHQVLSTQIRKLAAPVLKQQ
ncbi:hypothetical protein JF50_15945 [Pseudoalteromonas luteoviolacea]|uniref:Fibronectin type-III domain-containing protein n=1 Tax=Pseudoalteromonas luteoviolacea TaxID=43657 RepID=A0A0C1Q5I2_9GAMM|nr:hypothetical protein JF50_15945 [Pseudoalteromonas luteoviolacea]